MKKNLHIELILLFLFVTIPICWSSEQNIDKNESGDEIKSSVMNTSIQSIFEIQKIKLTFGDVMALDLRNIIFDYLSNSDLLNLHVAQKRFSLFKDMNVCMVKRKDIFRETLKPKVEQLFKHRKLEYHPKKFFQHLPPRLMSKQNNFELQNEILYFQKYKPKFWNPNMPLEMRRHFYQQEMFFNIMNHPNFYSTEYQFQQPDFQNFFINQQNQNIQQPYQQNFPHYSPHQQNRKQNLPYSYQQNSFHYNFYQQSRRHNQLHYNPYQENQPHYNPHQQTQHRNAQYPNQPNFYYGQANQQNFEPHLTSSQRQNSFFQNDCLEENVNPSSEAHKDSSADKEDNSKQIVEKKQ